MDHFEVKVGEVNKPACLSTIKCLGLTEIGQVFVVGEDLYWKRGAMEVVTPRLQGANDGEEFTVVDIIVALRRGEGLREVGTRMPLPIGISLKASMAMAKEADKLGR